ncbi:hypothetical protein CU048_11880 [Beijerinckiaceae bacterium]|nr:hypothetical protein CU048_11880 [Beijerinckiaceae bacterium]
MKRGPDVKRPRFVSNAADRVARDLENLYWREILWRGSMRKDKVLPMPNGESLNTLRVISPGVCITVAPGNLEPRIMCSQVEGVGTPAPEWFATVYNAFFGQHVSITPAICVRWLGRRSAPPQALASSGGHHGQSFLGSCGFARRTNLTRRRARGKSWRLEKNLLNAQAKMSRGLSEFVAACRHAQRACETRNGAHVEMSKLSETISNQNAGRMRRQ